MFKKRGYRVALLMITGFIILSFHGYAQPLKNSICISGHFENVQKPDSVYLYFWSHIISSDKRMFTPHKEAVSAVDEKGNFVLKISNAPALSYISLGWNKDVWGNIYENLELYVAAPGDNVYLIISGTKPAAPDSGKNEKGERFCMNCQSFCFSGKGAEKYQCRYEMDSTKAEGNNQWSALEAKMPYSSHPKTEDNFKRIQNRGNYILNKELAVLSKFKDRLNNKVFTVLKTDVIGASLFSIYNSWNNSLAFRKSLNSKKQYAAIWQEDSSSIHKYIVASDTLGKSVPETVLAQSAMYPDYLLLKAVLQHRYYNRPVASFIMDNYQGVLKDRLLVSHLLNYGNTYDTSTADSLMQSALAQVKEPYYREELLSLYKQNKKNAAVYNFSLPNPNDEIIKLSDFKGKVVFVDFWYVGCENCAEYYKDVVSKVEENFKNNPDVAFISICITADKKSWVKGINSDIYTSPALPSVTNLHATNGSNDPVVRQFNVYGYPHPLLIDKEGRVFSNSSQELRSNGVKGLTEMINKALK